MNISRLVKRFEHVITDNAPLILTSLGVVGVGATAFLTGRASFQAAKNIEDANSMARINGEDTLSPRETIFRVWKFYIPAAGVLVLTCTSVIMANKINATRMAALAAGVALSRNELAEYRDKVREAVGGKKVDKEARRKMVDDRLACLEDADIDDAIHTGKGNVLFVDSYSMRVFKSSNEAVKQAENQVLNMILREGSATVSDWYDKLGLEHTALSEDYGWNKEVMFEVESVARAVQEGRHKGEPCFMLVYDSGVILRPWKGSKRFPGDDPDVS